MADHAYTHLKGPIPWMAPETFDAGEKGRMVSPASDVYMLGSCFVEVATGCERQPFDWLTPSSAFLFRGHETTRTINCLQVGGVWIGASGAGWVEARRALRQTARSLDFADLT